MQIGNKSKEEKLCSKHPPSPREKLILAGTVCLMNGEDEEQWAIGFFNFFSENANGVNIAKTRCFKILFNMLEDVVKKITLEFLS